MQKAKTFDIEDSNIEMLGSQDDLDARKKKAGLEPAWNGTGEEGVTIWRIEKFKVVAWPKEEYGKFYSGDSYITLVSYRIPDVEKIAHDIFFWIGKDSSQDEYGTAAFKTVELDDYLNYHKGSDPVQHREIEGEESEYFVQCMQKYAKCRITTMKGGVDSGFRKVGPTEYKTRLFHIKGKKNPKLMECAEVSTKMMNKGDCFILDAGLKLYLWIGSGAGIMEKAMAAEEINKMESERPKAESFTFDEKTSPPNKAFWDALGGKAEIQKAIPDTPPSTYPKKMLKVSDESGELKMTKLSSYAKSNLDTKDVFICDVGASIYVWLGNEATDAEKGNGLAFATKYISENNRPKKTAIIVIKESSYAPSFQNTF